MTDQPLIFCAIDTNDLSRACNLASAIAPVTGGIKLGLEFFNHFGPAGVEAVLKAAPTAQLFIDLKFHDIPNTVAGAVRGICSHFSPAYLNVHSAGGRVMMEAAKDACGAETKLLAVTLLTSLDAEAVGEVGYQADIAAQVERMALLTKDSGLDGVVCSAHEIAALRKACGEDFALMVPGIRPEGSASADQKRVMTPSAALSAGARHLVIGRPITGADDPAAAAAAILNNI